MKISITLMSFAVIAMGAGCRTSEHPVALNAQTTTVQTVQTSPSPQIPAGTASLIPGAPIVEQGSSRNFDYTIQTIPNARLSATSREGDNPKEVYSSNIIGVFVTPHKSATNSVSSPSQDDNSLNKPGP